MTDLASGWRARVSHLCSFCSASAKPGFSSFPSIPSNFAFARKLAAVQQHGATACGVSTRRRQHALLASCRLTEVRLSDIKLSSRNKMGKRVKLQAPDSELTRSSLHEHAALLLHNYAAFPTSKHRSRCEIVLVTSQQQFKVSVCQCAGRRTRRGSVCRPQR